MEQEILYGAVKTVVFQNPENGYTVLRLLTQDGETVTVVGTIPMTAVGERLSITGHWTAHASYGKQFEAELLERFLPESRSEILAFLSSRAVKGVGEKTAQRIVAAFGEKSLEVLENEPELLAQVPGISLSKAREISDNFRRQVGMRRLMEFLAGYHLPAALALRLYRAYGELAVDAVREDPYMLSQPYFGASSALVDRFALELGVEADDSRRIEAGVLFELSYNQSAGHVFIPRGKLAQATAEGVCAWLGVAWEGEQAGEAEPWYAGARAWAVELGIADGTRPMDGCTRAEAWTMLQRLYDAVKAGK